MRGWYSFVGVVLLVAVATGVAIVAAVSGRDRDRGFHVGDCVAVAPDSAGELHTTRADCEADHGFTVGALADEAGDCVPDKFDRFRPPFADTATEQLCLVPNLVVGHCYSFGVPMSMLDPVSCSDGGPAAFRVTNRLDIDNPKACPDGKYQYAMTYPSPARTYCTEALT